MTTPRWKILPLALATLVFAACGGSEGEEPVAPDAEQGELVSITDPPSEPDTVILEAEPEELETVTDPAPEPEPEPEPVVVDNPTLEVTLTPVGITMAFEQTEFTAAPGQTVHITFNNTADNPAMFHNVVVVRSADVINDIGMAALGASTTDYIPAAHLDDIIAYTPMSTPGTTVEVTFTAPSTAGDYPYICTFPGHYVTMQGIMHVEE